LIHRLEDVYKGFEISNGVAGGFLVAASNLNAPAVTRLVRSEVGELGLLQHSQELSTSVRDVRLTVARSLVKTATPGQEVYINAGGGVEFGVKRVVSTQSGDIVVTSSTVDYTIPRASVEGSDVIVFTASDPYPFVPRETNRTLASSMQTIAMSTMNQDDTTLMQIVNPQLSIKFDETTSPELYMWDGVYGSDGVQCSTSEVIGTASCTAPRLGDFVWMHSGYESCASYSGGCSDEGYCIGSRKPCGWRLLPPTLAPTAAPTVAPSVPDAARYTVEMILAVHTAVQWQNDTIRLNFGFAIADAFRVERDSLGITFSNMNRKLLDDMLHQHQMAIAQSAGISIASVEIHISDNSRHLMDGANVDISISDLTADEANSVVALAKVGDWSTRLVTELQVHGIHMDASAFFIDPLGVSTREQTTSTVPPEDTSVQIKTAASAEPLPVRVQDVAGNTMVYIMCVLGIAAVALLVLCLRRTRLPGQRQSQGNVQKIYMSDEKSPPMRQPTEATTRRKSKNRSGSPKIGMMLDVLDDSPQVVVEARSPKNANQGTQVHPDTLPNGAIERPVFPLPPITRLDPHGTQSQRIKKTNRVEEIKPGELEKSSPRGSAWKD